MARTYKTDKTTYLVREIPVELWKKFKISSVLRGDDDLNDTFLSLIKEQVKTIPQSLSNE
tara:strand:- start:95 stop:274 length:180 start_codon:yes stop_codon:yes gene_type:complete